MKKDLRLKHLPEHIECFDNSNLQGTNPVAACVVFRGAVPSKREYRHYHVKSVVGPDDFASMEEVVYRRYRRLINEKKDLPQLVIVDGGKGQLNAAIKSLEKLNITTEKYLEFIFTKNAFDMGYYERISPDCYANDAGETYCKGVKP
ncbi:hypothetical protein LCGC14_0586060 [marine sediment metagenome]|uniref:UvrC family homology region profile domain-containing protein n=1 Tax=marine sediment metagenome TaxID=412755 RepID=A0A0F9RET3_9ZZZZ